MSFEILEPSSPIPSSALEIASRYTFKLETFQMQACDAIEKGHDVIVSANTGSGKTLVAEHAILYHLNHNPGKRIIYTTPIKALSNQIYSELKRKLPVNVGILTGDNKIDANAPVIVATMEIPCNSLFKLKQSVEHTEQSLGSDFIKDVSLFIFDEIHYINDKDRGTSWEQTLVLLPQFVQIVGLSATIDNVAELAEWIASIKTRPMTLVKSYGRTVPLRHYIFAGDKIHEIMSSNNRYDSQNFHYAKHVYEYTMKERKSLSHMLDIENLVKYLQKEDLLQAIFFSFSKKNCETYANSLRINLLTPEESQTALDAFDRYMRPHKSSFETLYQYVNMRDLVGRGIAYHHSGLLGIVKEVVEILFKERLIKIIFGTETLSVGLNLPARTVVFTELKKCVDGTRRPLSTAEYKQASGRAGRRGLDTNGHAILLPIYGWPDESDIKSVLLGDMPKISSKFDIDYRVYLKAIQSEGVDIQSLFDRSLLNKENASLKRVLLAERYRINNELSKVSEQVSMIDSNTMSKLEEYHKLVQQSVSEINGFRVTLPKKLSIQLGKLRYEIERNKELKSYYDLIVQEKKLKQQLSEINSQIGDHDIFLTERTQAVIGFLVDAGFLDGDRPSTKGVISAQINECNCILLTEIITSGLLERLSISEIVALISLFSNPSARSNDEEEYIPSILTNELAEVKSMIERFKKIESENGIISNDEFWYICTNNIDIAYRWASGATVREIVEELHIMQEYEGNFIRNMLKIYNVIHDIACICKLINKLDLVQKLESVDSLILRDIVSVKSLYL